MWTSAVHNHAEFGFAAAGFVLLVGLNTPPLLVVALSVVGAAVFAMT